jgi:PAS domain S-box-containing protein
VAKKKARSGKNRTAGNNRAKPKSNQTAGWENKLLSALEAAGIAAWEWNVTDNSITWSLNAHLLFGLTKESFDGTFETYLNLIHHEDKIIVFGAFQEALKTKGGCHLEHRLVWPNGTIHWVEVSGKVTANKFGKATIMTGTMQDISRKKRIEFESEDWQTRHELITRSAGLVIYDYDIPTGNIRWSGNIQDVLGFTGQELGNVDQWLAMIHPDDQSDAFSTLELAQENLKAYDVYYRFKTSQGHYIHMHDRGFFIPDKQGRAIRMLGMMMDVTQRIQAEKVIRDNTLYRQSLESAMPGILYVFDTVTKTLEYANRNISTFLDYSFSDLKRFGDNLLEKVIHPDDLKNIPSWSNEEPGVTKETELRILRKDGHYACFFARESPFRHDEHGNVTQVIGIAQDITGRKEVSNQLRQSEQSYRELFNTVSEAIYLLRADETFIDVNDGVCRLFGCGKKDLIGGNFSAVAAKDKNDFDVIKEKVLRAFEGEQQSFEFWGKKKSGDIFLQEIRLAKGSYFGKEIIIATGRDITERRFAEQALRESEQRFRMLQQASFGGIGLHDQGFILDCNQGLCDITGYSYEELVGRNGLELIVREWRTFVLDKIRSGYDQTYDVEGLRKDGSRYALEIHGKNIPYQGRVIRVTEFRDITERKNSQEQIVSQNAKLVAVTEDLVRKNSQLEEFTQIVSHNLRAPVGNITTLLTFFENATSEAEKKEYLNLLKESGDTILNMLNDVNEVLKIKQNRNIEKQEIRFDDTFQKVKSMLNGRISQAAAKVTAEFAEPRILYPGIYLESIMLNLLDNALKYRHPDRNPEIHFRTYTERNGNMFLEVRDNGLGLNLEKYGHYIFKLRKTFHKHAESRGIGLFLIKNQIEAMGGEIRVESRENEGSAFFVNFNKYQTDGE